MSVRALLAQARTEVMLTLRRGESLVVTLAIPLGVLIAFSKLGLSIPKGYRRSVDFLVPGVLALAVMSAAMVSLGIATAFERRYGVLKRLGSTPLSRGGLIAAKTATVLVLEVIQFVLLIATAAALGWHVPARLVLAIPFVLVGTIAFAGIGMLLAGTLRAEATLAVANGLFFVLLFFGGMAYPLEKLPLAVRDAAKLLPAAALSECLRGVLVAGRSLSGGSVAVLVAWAVVMPALAARRFRWEE
jgi:ABC-2 type transport system permease protein